MYLCTQVTVTILCAVSLDKDHHRLLANVQYGTPSQCKKGLVAYREIAWGSFHYDRCLILRQNPF